MELTIGEIVKKYECNYPDLWKKVYPRVYQDMGRINWDAVSEDMHNRFWRYHKLIWLEPVLVGGDSE